MKFRRWRMEVLKALINNDSYYKLIKQEAELIQNLGF
jgi:hypothetical protein